MTDFKIARLSGEMQVAYNERWRDAAGLRKSAARACLCSLVGKRCTGPSGNCLGGAAEFGIWDHVTIYLAPGGKVLLTEPYWCPPNEYGPGTVAEAKKIADDLGLALAVGEDAKGRYARTAMIRLGAAVNTMGLAFAATMADAELALLDLMPTEDEMRYV